MRRLLWTLVALAGCTGPLAQLDAFKKAEAAGATGALADAVLDADCDGRPGQSAACPQLQASKARACLVRARSSAVTGRACPPSATRRDLQCAADFYAAATSGGYVPPNRAAYAGNHGRALYCLSNLTDGPQGIALAQQARSVLAAGGPSPEIDILAASSALHLARSSAATPTDRCQAARDATEIAVRGLAAGPAPELAEALRSVRYNAGLAAQALPNCGGQ